MKSRSRSTLVLSSLLVLSTAGLAACDSTVGVGGDPETAVKGNATPAPSPSGTDPVGTVINFKEDITDLAAVKDTIAVRTADQVHIGNQGDFAAKKAKNIDIDSTCGDLSSSAPGFVLACPDKVLLIDPSAPESPEEIAMDEDFQVTAATQISTGEVFVTADTTAVVGRYKDGTRDGEISVEAGSDQILAVPNADGDDGIVRIQRSDSTIQNIDWPKDRAGGRLRVGQGVGQIAVGDNGVVLASDTEGGRIAIYTSDDVVRLHQYGVVDGAPWAVAWDDSRELAWVTTTDNNIAHAYSIDQGVPKSRGDFATLADAQNIAALSNGTIVVASASGQGLQFVTDPHLIKES
ncbi:hypothetical protein GWO52_10015 [Corynebacterium macginleyi]|uniref:hypothetical protein n=1 Tax=Corynebacterium macginleyi TaxID=38290 RepID=UPI00190AFABA|nr:hypothetical protein [Corynebacterium macginleyi]MBK4138708.1 hypothetical protein [Corynebacterium macginleyi]